MVDINLPELEGLKQDAFYILISLVLVATVAGAHNLSTPDDPKEIGFVEIDTECMGLDVGYCIGIQKQDHTTINYDNYTAVEPGTENFYRKVEAELMLSAYETCDSDTTGMEWTSEVEYRNQTAEEWLEHEQVDLWPCEKTFHRNMTGQ